MNNQLNEDGPSPKIRKVETDFKKCFICQNETAEKLVENPKHGSAGKILQYIRERVKYGEQKYQETNTRIGSITEDLMKSNEAKWHGSCYSDTVHSSLLERAKQKYQQGISKKGHITSMSEPCTSQRMFRRSQAQPFNKEVCFFCDDGPQYENPLHKVATTGAGDNLK